MNGGAWRRTHISSSDRPVWVQCVDVLVDRCQLLLGYERVPGLAELVERYADLGLRLVAEY